MKTIKLHFCDGKGYEMKEMWLAESLVDPVYETLHYVCPMCNFIIRSGKKVKGVLTERRSENGHLSQKP